MDVPVVVAVWLKREMRKGGTVLRVGLRMLRTQASRMIEGGGVRKLPAFRSFKMSSPVPLKAKGKQKVTDDDVLTLEDLEDGTDSESSSGSSLDSGSDGDSDSDSNSASGSSSGSDQESESGAESGGGIRDEPPLSRDELLVYLENIRRRFLEKPAMDSFADQDEEVSIFTPKKT